MSTFTLFGAILISLCVLTEEVSKNEEALDKSDKNVLTYEAKSEEGLSMKDALDIKDFMRKLVATTKNESNQNTAETIKRFADKNKLCEKNKECLFLNVFSDIGK